MDLSSRDVALLASSVWTSNDNINIEYSSKERRDLTISLDNSCEVRIGPKESEFTYQKYSCLNDESIEEDQNQISFNTIKLVKEGNKFYLEEV